MRILQAEPPKASGLIDNEWGLASCALSGRLNIGAHFHSRAQMAEKVPGWLQRVLLPQISEIKGEITALDARLEGFEAKVDGEFRAVHSEISRLDEKIDSVDAKLSTRIDAMDERLTTRIGELDKRWDVAQRLAVIEGKVHELEARR